MTSPLTRHMPHDNWRKGEPHCYRCGKPLGDGKVMLDLHLDTHRWSDKGWPPAESQGGFYFGPDCAAIVLKEMGPLPVA